MKKIKYLIFLLIPLMLLISCSDDITNPNAATDEQILSSTEGLIGMVNGMKFRYSIGAGSALYAGLSANGLSTNELQILNAGNAELAQLGNGFDNVSPDNGVLTNLWTSLNLLKADADKVIDNAPSVINDLELNIDVVAAASLFKALALGTMAQYWEHVPTSTEQAAVFSTREEALREAIALLSTALRYSGSDGFVSAIGGDIDFKNTASALTARYQMMLGDYAAASTAANGVDLTSNSVFVFDNVTTNPVFRSSITTQNVYDVNPLFGLSGELEPDAADGRIAFYLDANAESGKGFFASDNTSIPLYLSGEMILIQAEVAARGNNLESAVTELNKILTKTDDSFGINAGLPSYSGEMSQDAILTEIYRNRCIELYMSGLKLEDSRRFERPGPTSENHERNRNFYPFPTVERDNNGANVPNDPAG